MMSDRCVRAMLGLEPQAVVICLLTLAAPGMTPLYVCNNNEDMTSSGQLFPHYPFNITLPSDTEEVPRAELEIANTDRRLGQAIEALGDAPVATIQIVLADTPDLLELEFGFLDLRAVTINDSSVSGSLAQSTIDQSPYPPLRVTQKSFPGLY